MEFIKTFLVASLHVIAATIFVPFICTLTFYSIKPVLPLILSLTSITSDAPLLLPLFPMQMVTGLLFGLWVSKICNTNNLVTAYFAWIVPLCWFLIICTAWSPGSVFAESRWTRFIWSNSLLDKKAQLVTTLPLVTSLTYATGAWLGSNVVKWTKRSAQ